MQADTDLRLEMDKRDGSMTHSLLSNPDTPVLLSNTAATTSSDREVLTNARNHLHPMTNFNETREPVWNRQVYSYETESWSTDGATYAYVYPYSKKSPSIYRQAPQERSSDLHHKSSYGAVQSSFSATSDHYDPLNNLNTNPELQSPPQSHEDEQWQMYLTASLSNPLESLGLSSAPSPPRLPYSSGSQDGIAIPEGFSIPSEQYSLSNISTFLNGMEHSSNTFGQLSFPASPPQAAAPFPPSHHVAPNFNRTPDTDRYLSQRVQLAPRIIDDEADTSSKQYASLLGLDTSTFDFGPSHFAAAQPQALADIKQESPSDSSLPGRPSFVGKTPLMRRGLCGWSGSDNIDSTSSIPSPVIIHQKRLRSISPSSSGEFRPAQGVTTSQSSGASSDQTSSSRDVKRPRKSTSSSLAHALDFDLGDSDDDNGCDDGDSDDYCPSRSPSVERTFASAFPVEFLRETGVQPNGQAKKKSRRGKGKAKGSAALALAVVTQLGAKIREGSEQIDDEDIGAVLVQCEGKNGIRKRKNHPIPLPVPVPNLNKKSRGRKVPFVAYTSTPSSAGSESSLDAPAGNRVSSGSGDSLKTTGRPRRKTSRMPTPVSDEVAGDRVYVCVVPGCGKCFVRGEHLKRHVRSIHTYDKPHPCPFEGCEKSFSRRDNLGQHVRIHLQP